MGKCCGGFIGEVFNAPTEAVSDAVSGVGKAIAESPIAQVVISAGLAVATGGASIPYTAAALGVNQTAQGGDIGAGLLAAGGSYLAGTGAANYAASGNVFGAAGASQYLPSWAGGTTATGAAGMGGGTGLTLGGGGGLTLGGSGTAAAGMGGGTGVLGTLGGTGVASTYGAGAASGLGSLWNTATSSPNLLGAAAQLGGSYLNQRAASDAASTQADAQIRAAQIAADAAKFRPVGVTTNFGSSQFGYDANGNLNSAGYALNPLLQGQQNQLMGASQGMLDQFTGSQAATAPMGEAAQRMMSLGNQYLATDPQAQAAKYMSEQQGLLAPGRDSEMANLQAQLQAQGRGGLSMGGGVNGQGASNPQMQALYNARMQQDNQIAANATQGGMDYAKFGAGLTGSGGQMMRDQYGTQSAAYNPYQTAMGGAQYIEGLGQNAMDMGINIGAKGTAANAAAGGLLAGGMTNAANTIGNQAQQAGSTWGNLLQGGANTFERYSQPSGNQYDPNKYRLTPL
jgi:hypothetical protein